MMMRGMSEPIDCGQDLQASGQAWSLQDCGTTWQFISKPGASPGPCTVASTRMTRALQQPMG